MTRTAAAFARLAKRMSTEDSIDAVMQCATVVAVEAAWTPSDCRAVADAGEARIAELKRHEAHKEKP